MRRIPSLWLWGWLWGSLCGLVGLAACAAADDTPVASTASALATGDFHQLKRCGTPDPGVMQADAADSAVAQRTALAPTDRKKLTRIPVYFHIITNSAGQGDVSALVPAQIDVLNAAYALVGFKFHLVAIEVTQNDAWFAAGFGSKAERQMKKALRQGGPDTLNVYTGENSDGLLGWATFPSDFASKPWDDGIVIFDLSMPGGGLEFPDDPSEEPDGVLAYDHGDTLTHEAGHWFGLFHTFQGGCKADAGKGDRIADTPAEAEPQFFCVARDSCTGKKFPGTDPIHNFMDYGDDDCLDQFTDDQFDRMQDQFGAFRAD